MQKVKTKNDITRNVGNDLPKEDIISKKNKDITHNTGKAEKSAKPSIEDIYKKKTQHEHILTLPDTYIGSVESDTKEMFVYDDEEKRIIKKDITYVPGLYKIYDEILVNARDH
jgi:hypothetical protein